MQTIKYLKNKHFLFDKKLFGKQTCRIFLVHSTAQHSTYIL